MRFASIPLALTTLLLACSDPGPTPPVPTEPPPPLPAPTEPPPPPLDPATRETLATALAAAPSAAAIAYRESEVGMTGDVSRSFTLALEEGAFTGTLTCAVMGNPRELALRLDASVVRAALAHLDTATLTSEPEDGLVGIPEGSASRSLTIGAGSTALQLESRSFAAAHDPWRIDLGAARAFTSSRVVEDAVAALVVAAGADRCDMQPASTLTPAGGIRGHL